MATKAPEARNSAKTFKPRILLELSSLALANISIGMAISLCMDVSRGVSCELTGVLERGAIAVTCRSRPYSTRNVVWARARCLV